MFGQSQRRHLCTPEIADSCVEKEQGEPVALQKVIRTRQESVKNNYNEYSFELRCVVP